MKVYKSVGLPEWADYKTKVLGPYKNLKEETLYGSSKSSDEPQFECDFGSIALKFEKNKEKLSRYLVNSVTLMMIATKMKRIKKATRKTLLRNH